MTDNPVDCTLVSVAGLKTVPRMMIMLWWFSRERKVFSRVAFCSWLLGFGGEWCSLLPLFPVYSFPCPVLKKAAKQFLFLWYNVSRNNQLKFPLSCFLILGVGYKETSLHVNSTLHTHTHTLWEWACIFLRYSTCDTKLFLCLIYTIKYPNSTVDGESNALVKSDVNFWSY